MGDIAIAAFLHDIGKIKARAYGLNRPHEELSAEILKELGYLEEAELVKNHHSDTLEGDSKIIAIANKYAGWLDRVEEEALDIDEQSTIALKTPFSFIYFDKPPKTYYYPLQPLSGDIEISENRYSNSKEKYQKIYESLIEDLKKANSALEIKSIYEKYTTFIPSSNYKTYPDVSLYDHSLATAAIAVAIKNGDEKEFSLIQGDFTSIQNFIFSKKGESNKKLAKILRAKSLFVNVTTEMVALKIVKELNLSIFNIVMNAGGKFTILSHKLKEADYKKLESIKEWVNEEISKVNFLATKFLIKSIDFDYTKFKLGEFSKVYRDMALAFEREKLKFTPKFNQFSNYLSEAKVGVCEVCGVVPANGVCKYCKRFEEIGDKLVKGKKYINFDFNSIFDFDISDNKKENYFSFSEYPIKRVANYVPKFEKYDKRYELVDEEEVNIGGVKSFYHIAVDGLEEKDGYYYGRKYLAVLKADIDNLGKIFICGFRGEDTFSRILYLSRMIDYFFTDILMDFVKGKNIYTIFAGGDDLFLVGHYEDIIKTYKFILEKLKNYTQNENFHLSAAIRLFRPSVPIHLIAELAEDELEIAKSSGKDSVNIFDVVYKNSEFLEFLKFRDFFEEVLEKSSSSFMYKLYTFIEMAYNVKNGVEVLENSRWIYMMRYLIQKNFEDEEVRGLLYKVKDLIEKYDKKLILPLNLALYANRKY